MIYFVQCIELFLREFHELAAVFGQDEAQRAGQLHRRALGEEH